MNVNALASALDAASDAVDFNSLRAAANRIARALGLPTMIADADDAARVIAAGEHRLNAHNATQARFA